MGTPTLHLFSVYKGFSSGFLNYNTAEKLPDRKTGGTVKKSTIDSMERIKNSLSSAARKRMKK